MPKISVIVPVYKVEPYLRRCIESILAQTYTDFELILVDDGSPDNCPAICDEYAQKDSRIVVIHQKNGGLSAARNAGLDTAVGEYIAFVDSDDWIDPEMYETLVEIAEKNHADIAQCGYRFYRPWKTTNQILDGDNTETIKTYNNIQALNELYYGPQMFGGITIMVWNKIYARSLLSNLRFTSWNGVSIGEDIEFTPKALYKASRVVTIDKSFYNYNIHLGTSSTSGMEISVNKIRSHLYYQKCIALFFEQNSVKRISEHTKSTYYNSLINSYYECWIRRRKDPSFANEVPHIFDEISQHKQSILALGGWKNKLFFFSRFLYCTAVWNLRAAKRAKYKLRVMLTGRN